MKSVLKFMVYVLAVIVILPIMGISAEKSIKMATTTSTQASGLLDILLPEFEKSTDIKVKVIAKGTGAAIRDGRDGNVDIIFVHAKIREEKFIQDGFGTQRYPVMHNDFIILGPASDPAKIKGLKSVVQAFKKIATAEQVFISRGDDSGTHTKEQDLWRITGLALGRPSGAWYLSIGQGMGKTLTLADEKQAYVLTDRGTYLKYKFGRSRSLQLEILCQGDPLLLNPYGIIPINPKKHPHVRHHLAKQLVQWLLSPQGQGLIDGYRLHGKPLFHPDGKKLKHGPVD